MMELVSEAIIFAVKAHDGMYRRKSKAPYILHPMEAAAIVGSMTADQEVIAAAVLHDVVEDAGISLKQIEEIFGERVARLVSSETENKREELPAEDTWQIRKSESIELLKKTTDICVKMVYLGDKLANMRAFYLDWLLEGENLWQAYNQKDPEKQYWYHQSIADATTELSHTSAWQEYVRLVHIIFGKDDEKL